MNKIENIYKIINSSNRLKPKFNMMTKGPSRKQVIIYMSTDNKTKFIETSSAHITNIIITNKVAFSLDLQTIEKYIKNANLIDTENVDIPHLPQSKLYLKIIDIPYFLENTNVLLLIHVVETIIKENHIFNNIMVASRP